MTLSIILLYKYYNYYITSIIIVSHTNLAEHATYRSIMNVFSTFIRIVKINDWVIWVHQLLQVHSVLKTLNIKPFPPHVCWQFYQDLGKISKHNQVSCFTSFQGSSLVVCHFFWHLSTSLDEHFSEFWLASLSKIPSARYLLALVVASKASLGFAEYLIQPSFLNLLMNLPLTYRPHGSPYLFRFVFVPGVFIIFNWHILLSHNFF